MGLSSLPKRKEQLAELYRYIEENATAEAALRYTTAVVDYCEGLETPRMARPIEFYPLTSHRAPQDPLYAAARTTAPMSHPPVVPCPA